MRVRLYDLLHFTMSEGGEFVSLVTSVPIEIEEGQDIEITAMSVTIFDGTVSHVYTNAVGIKIIQAVVTSVSSGGDSSCAAVGRTICEIEALKKKLSEREWGDILRHFAGD